MWTWQDTRYRLLAVTVEDYRRHMRVRSPRWGTVSLSRRGLSPSGPALQLLQLTNCPARSPFPMSRIKIGVCLPSFGLPLRPALREAQKLGIAGIELDAVGDLAPKQLSRAGPAGIAPLAPLPQSGTDRPGAPLRHGLDVPENQEARIDHLRQVMDLSFELGPRRVIVQAGPLIEDVKDPRHGFLTQALAALAQHGDRVGTTLALETGPEDGPHVERFLARFDTGSLAVNLNPAHLYLAGHNPYEAVRVLSRRIVHAHANDARGSSQQGKGLAQEVPLGHGDLDWLQLLGNFEEIGYHGWLNVVVGSASANRLAEAAAGVDFLRRLTG